ncbi:DNA methyltransferase [Pseudomonas luteola]
MNSIDEVVISNPKLYMDCTSSQESRIFPYYAGYSKSFAENIISSTKTKSNSVVLDPWNGSGTTTKSAYCNGKNSIGFDLNPVMVIVAKAAMLSPLEYPSLVSIAKTLVEQAQIYIQRDCSADDMLLTWFIPKSTVLIRSLELSINKILICNDSYVSLNDNAGMEKLSPLAAFFYVALFRTVRRLLKEFLPSNPTWVKHPKNKLNRKRSDFCLISTIFIEEVKALISWSERVSSPFHETKADISLKIGNAAKILIPDNTVDLIISSPPYCTRIDYAVATSLELAVIRFTMEEYEILRRTLTGTSTVNREIPEIEDCWGSTCINFLENLYSHPSKASKGYYYKNHVQYFRSISSSLKEISRVVKPGGMCFLVVQDSYYKEIHNDVPKIISEMANFSGLNIKRRVDFASTKSMVTLNPESKKYLKSRKSIESVICLIK